jgi:stage II sporulation protein D
MEWEVQAGSMGNGGGQPGGQVVIRGRGFGHGVGMCQYCARAMAARGDDWREMVLRFYPGARVERAY